MSDEKRRGRSSDDIDALRKALKSFVVDVRSPQHASSVETDRMGREQQRRATAYARARGQL